MRSSLGGGLLGGGAPPSPATLAGLTLWYDGTAPMFTDAAGTTPATVPNGRVRRTNQPAPLAGFWAAPSDPVRPFYNKSGRGGNLDYQVGFTTNLAQPAGLTLPGNNYTMGVCGLAGEQNGMSANQLSMIIGGQDNGGNAGLALTPSLIDTKLQQLAAFVASAQVSSELYIPVGAKYWATVTGDATGTRFRVSVGGAPVQTSFVANAALPASIFNTSLGQIASPLNLHGALAQYVGLTGAAQPGSARLAQLEQWLAYQAIAIAYPTAPSLCIWIGDSNTTGFGAVTQSLTAFARCQVTLQGTKSNAPRFVNAGFPSQSIEDAIANFASRIAPLLAGPQANKLVFVQVGAASLIQSAGNTPAQAFAKLQTLCALVTAAGGKPIVIPVLPIDNIPATGPNFEADRNTYNGLMLANHSFAFDWVPNASLTGINLIADCSGANYQGDKQHLSNAGQPVYATAINTVLTANIP